MATEITVPRIDVPFPPSRTNPLEGQLFPATLEWAGDFGLVTTDAAAERLRRYQIEVMVSYYAPTVDDWPALRLFTDWMTWAALFEDQIDEATAGLRPDLLAPVLDDFRSVLLGESGTQGRPNPATAALRDLWRRTGGDSPRVWRRRFYDHMSEAFRAQLRASVHRATGAPMDVATCMELRGKLGWVAFAHDLQHHTHRVWLPDTVYCSTAYQRLLWGAADVIMWTNDLVSYTKEAAAGETSNLGLALQAQHGLAPQQAVDHVHHLITDRIHRFLEAGRELPQFLSSLPLSDDDRSAAAQCLELLRMLVRGSHDWHLSSERYRPDGHTAADKPAFDDLFGVAHDDIKDPTAS
ncbi:terpene synthase family protein [Streptomyces sp. NPDC005180]|uniref:terpene synthase family protein n=1 Tax=Streptomyces sp. NPDC005180 TaxID=3156868 RepID=UPI0033BA1AFB